MSGCKAEPLTLVPEDVAKCHGAGLSCTALCQCGVKINVNSKIIFINISRFYFRNSVPIESEILNIRGYRILRVENI